MSRWDDLTSQIFRDHLIMEQTSKDVIAGIKDDLNKDGTILKSKEDKIVTFKKYLDENDILEVEGNHVMYRFTLSQKKLTRLRFNKFKGLVNQSLTVLLINDYLHDSLLDTFSSLFSEIITTGKKVDDLELLDLKDILIYSKVFIELFEERLAELKKK